MDIASHENGVLALLLGKKDVQECKCKNIRDPMRYRKLRSGMMGAREMERQHVLRGWRRSTLTCETMDAAIQNQRKSTYLRSKERMKVVRGIMFRNMMA